MNPLGIATAQNHLSVGQNHLYYHQLLQLDIATTTEWLFVALTGLTIRIAKNILLNYPRL